ncbi:MarR family winged helix-turn-helix transcriptional regulator [Paenibacillus sediminis]|uniref:MarR family winged helix-turn-helix transcriptional regulator n=1 Tax=Paenibacillus sediminis TaxID=664909 RepID=UPI001AE67CBC|nr:MarR family transcriptional regulator [Paenibacillus sediminis]
MSRFSSPEQSFGFRYGNTFRRVTSQFASRLKPYDITPEQWSVLYCAYKHEGINQRELSELAGKDQPTTTRILDLLHKKGWIERQDDPADRRAYLIHVTPSAKELIEQTIPIEVQYNDELLQGVTDEQLAVLDQIMNQIKHNLDNMKLQ